MNSPLSSDSRFSKQLSPGDLLSHYEVKSKLGFGGMGEVYLAWDRKLERKVALKILSPRVAQNQEGMLRFVQEAKATAALNDQNIAHTYDISAVDDLNFIAMEFIDGQTLRQYMHGTKMQVGEVLDIAIQIASALSAAHAGGIVHRDIKPENIMRREDGVIKVLDFGLARMTEAKDSELDSEARTIAVVKTEPGTLLGTYPYMSPEQARAKSVDARTDIFSLGVVIYEMVTGTVPFTGETKMDVLIALADKDILPRFGPDFSPPLLSIVSKALTKDRENRYQTIKHLLSDLMTIKQQLEFTANVDGINQLLKAAIREKGIDAASCTFYVRDLFWPDEWRLIAMPGVQLAETLAFSFPPHSKRILEDGALEIFSEDAQSNKDLREQFDWPLDQVEPEKRFLFGDFIEREGIKSAARLAYQEKGRKEAVLFVNFDKPTTFGEPLKRRLRNLLADCVKRLDNLKKELEASEKDDLAQAMRMCPPTHEGSSGLYESDKPLDLYLKRLLAVVLRALDLDRSTAFGTIHVYEPQTRTLQLKAYVGDVDRELANSLSVAKGQGIISYVAIRRKAVLITDLANSTFDAIHYAFNPTRVKSEVAIPIFEGEDLLGVLNLESFLPNAFRPMCVRSLSFAVDRAAVAQRLSRSNDRMKSLIGGLLELCRDAVQEQSTGGFSFDRLADLVTRELKAVRGGIWRYYELDNVFRRVGINPHDYQPGLPRPQGWSRFILEVKWPVWITNIDKETPSEIRYWNGEAWAEPPSKFTPPSELNPNVRADTRSILGIPIKGRFGILGIAWLEYDHFTPPENELVKLASGFADYAGLVIEFSDVDLVDKNALQRIGGELNRNLLASGELKLDGFNWIEGYVRSEPFPNSQIGGDFHAARVINERTAGVLVGDGGGHAVTGALNMLPLLTAFEAFWKESRSATHIIDKIRDISHKLGVQGSAIYCVFTSIADERRETLWLSVTSAGHPFLVIIRRNGDAVQWPPNDSPARGGMLGVTQLNQPLAEEHTMILPGDVMIIFTDGLKMEPSEVASVGLDNKTQDPRTIADAVFSRALSKCQSLDDDATVLVIRVKDRRLG